MTGSESGGPSSPESLGVFPISPLLIIPSTVGGFSVYLRQGDHLVLYANKGERFTDKHRQRLDDLGIKRVFVKSEEKNDYEGYIQQNLGTFLEDDAIPVQDRVQVWYEATVHIVHAVFEQKLPRPLTGRRLDKVQSLVRSTIRFLTEKQALREMARFLMRGFSIYAHSIGVMVLTSCVLQTYEKTDEDTLQACALGALLHDLGKSRLPRDLLQKNLENFSPAELDLYKTHPALGVAMCATVPLPHAALNCILMHHERENGMGFPAGAIGVDIPYYVSVLAVCDVYDNHTRAGMYGPALKPFEALSRLQSARGSFETEAIKRLILVLANADIVSDPFAGRT